MKQGPYMTTIKNALRWWPAIIIVFGACSYGLRGDWRGVGAMALASVIGFAGGYVRYRAEIWFARRRFRAAREFFADHITGGTIKEAGALFDEAYALWWVHRTEWSSRNLKRAWYLYLNAAHQSLQLECILNGREREAVEADSAWN